MEGEFNSIIQKLQELLAVELLEYNNKNWLSGDDESRSRDKQSEITYLINRVASLRNDVVYGKRPQDVCETQSN